LCIAQPIRLGIQQRVQRLLHAAAYDTVEVALDPLIISHLQFSQIRGRQPYSIVRNILYVIGAPLTAAAGAAATYGVIDNRSKNLHQWGLDLARAEGVQCLSKMLTLFSCV
jgi:hypothetical protein